MMETDTVPARLSPSTLAQLNNLVASLDSIVRYGVRAAIENYDLRVERPGPEDIEAT